MSGSGYSQDLRQRQTQALVLAPQLRQSLKILQVAATDLRTEIQQELQNNPTLEELPPDEGISLDAPSPETNSREDDPQETQHGELDFSKEFEVLNKLDSDWRDYLNQAGGAQPYTSDDAERRQHLFDSLVSAPSLQEHLLQQAAVAGLNASESAALEYLIGILDERGFLSQKLSDAALQSGLPLPDLQHAAKVLRGFDPLGIGSQTLAECLLSQLTAQDRGSSLAARIVRDHFELLTRRRIPELARKLGASPDEIQKAIEVIGKLDPAPGRHFIEDINRVIEPDITVLKDDAGQWQVSLNSDYIPRLRLSNTYREMIAKGTLTKEERDYLRDKMRSGKFLIDSIEQRQRTIERITREILNAQMDFFEHGVSQLKPLTMTQVAAVVGVHETTVSRALANKYIKTPHGVFELKYFFTTGYQDESGASISNTSVKELIADLIAAEDRGAPLSDQVIVVKLRDKGLNIARRTVAKYREELGILPSNLRRDYA